MSSVESPVVWRRYIAALFALCLLSVPACGRPSPTSDFTPYRGPATALEDTRAALWLPEGALHRLRGPLELEVAAGGSCPATLRLGREDLVITPEDGWVLVNLPEGRIDLSTRSACGAGVALDLSIAASSSPGPASSGSSRSDPASGGSSRSDPASGGSSRPHLVLLSIDTLRPDFLGVYGDPGGLSPNLDAFAAGALRYTRARAHSPWTGPSVAALMSGRQSAGLDRMAELAPTLPTLAEALAAAGYRTVAAVNNPRLAVETGMGRGFDRYRTFAEDEPLVEALPGMLGGAGPRFLWVHLLGPHLPLDPSMEDLEAAGWDPALGQPYYQEDDLVKPDAPFSDLERRRIRTLYRADIRHADRNLGRALKVIEQKLPGAVIVLTSDHGEELWEHGAHGHGHSFHREVLSVPLLVRGPGFAPGGVENRLVKLCDVASSLLKAAGVTPPPTMECRGLQESGGERWAKAGNPLYGPRRLAVESPAWKLILEEAGPPAGLFELAVDPGELRDRRAEQPEVVSAMRTVAEAFVAGAAPPRGLARVALTISSLKPTPLEVTLRSDAPLEPVAGQPPGKWGVVEMADDGRRWTVRASPRAPDREGLVLELVLAASAPVTAEVRAAGAELPASSWYVAGSPAREGERTIRPDMEGWRSEGPVADEPRVDLWMQPRGEPPREWIFKPEDLARLKAIGYVQ